MYMYSHPPLSRDNVIATLYSRSLYTDHFSRAFFPSISGSCDLWLAKAYQSPLKCQLFSGDSDIFYGSE